MPARRRKQSNAMLYTLITFVGLFIATTTVAVIYYVKAEEYRTAEADLQREINDLASDRERQALGTIVGTKQPNETWLGKMVDYFDKTVVLIVGGVPEPNSVEVKVNNSNIEVSNVQKLVQENITIGDPNTTGLIQIVKGLKAELDKTINAKLELQKDYDELETRFENADKANFEKEQTLRAEKDKLLQEVADRKQKYDELSALLEQTTGEQVKTLRDDLQKAQDEMKALDDELQNTRKELKLAQDDLKSEKEKLSKIEPGPDREVLAQQPDGKIILVDNEAKIVHINIGSDEHVYPGLTFQVYDRGTSVKVDGIGKAEIQVFDVEKHYSVARIIPPLNYKVTMSDLYQEFTDSEEIAQIMLTLEKPYKERVKDFEEKFAHGSTNKLRILNNLSDAHEQRKNPSPIILDDIIANLIWDSSKVNVFVIAGDFDLDGNGNYDYDAIQRITALIEKWGGRVDDDISIDTDFLVLGQMPQITERPSEEEQDINPRAMDLYNALLQRLNRYNSLRDQAQTLWIPVFKYERFLHFIGYKTLANQAGSFQ